MRRSLRPDYRRAVILMVVLAMLALFAIVGLSFVLFAQNNNTRSNNFSLAWQKGFTGSSSQGNGNGGNNGNNGNNGQSGGQPFNPVSSDLVAKWAISQIIYDVPNDSGGVKSAIRGHSMARTIYGYNPNNLNLQPFNGSGRYSYTWTINGLNGENDRDLINYQYFSGFPLRDPEHASSRIAPTDPLGEFVGGANPPVTYPNLDNLFLAASRADGTQLMPSFHRPWLFGSNDPNTNPNWKNATGRFKTLRPRPIDNLEYYLKPDGTPERPGFPYPEDAGGDVKNKLGYPGNNDSYWIDMGYPVITAADGRKYKPLFAWLVEDLDNRVNVNTAGNLMGKLLPDGLGDHTSNQGWGKWEVSLARVLNNQNSPNEWRNLLLGTGGSIRGRYGPDKQPAMSGNSSSGTKKPRFFGQADWNGSDETAGYKFSGSITLPPALPSLTPFPTFPVGYGNGISAEHLNHASLYDYFRFNKTVNPNPPQQDIPWDDYRFGAGGRESDMRKMLINGRTMIDPMSPEICQLCPNSFDMSDPGKRRRSLLTDKSWQLGRTGIAPWLYRRNTAYGMQNTTNADGLPSGQAVPVAVNDQASRYLLRREEYKYLSTDPESPIRLVIQEAVNVGRNLTQYPHQSGTLSNYHSRFDVDPATGTNVIQAYNNAEKDRKELARDIFFRLLYVTGVPSMADRDNPTPDELKPIRWLAQLAVNIVDYIDEDEICTGFNYYRYAYQFFHPNFTDPGNVFEKAVAPPTPSGEKVPQYWVFGTELPAIVLNEVHTQYELPTDPTTKAVMSGNIDVKVWAELYTPFPGTPPVPTSTQDQDSKGWPLYVKNDITAQAAYCPYQIVIANTNSTAGGPLLARQDNVLGTPDQVRKVTKFDAPTVKTVGDATVPMEISPTRGSGYFIVGPKTNPDTRGNTIKNRAPVAVNVPWHQDDTMTLQVMYSDTTVTYTPDDRYDSANKTGGITVLLRRLANPHLPEQPDPDPAKGVYNPYITVDYMEQVPLNNVSDTNAVAVSKGKKQPYASELTTQIADQNIGNDSNAHTLGKDNIPSSDRVWLTHLDRQLVNPFELLTVSGCRPHQLTHRFLSGNNSRGHLVPWFDEDLLGKSPAESHRLYRLFAMLETPDRAAGISLRGRTPGKVNINTVWDFETFDAICDANLSNTFNQTDVKAAWRSLLSTRSPGLMLSPDPTLPAQVIGGGLTGSDKPILDLGVGFIPSGDLMIPEGRGIQDTIFRWKDPNVQKERLFQTGHSHPYMQNELLNKIANNITNRSNVFAVWLTVGFFDVVTEPATGRELLGEEIDKRLGKEVRYRFFCIIDRSQLVIAPQLTAGILPPGQKYALMGASTWVKVQSKFDPADPFYGLNGFITYFGNSVNGVPVQIPWEIKPGSILVIDRGRDSEETVVVEQVDLVNQRFMTTFRREHANGMIITMHGNPGPQPSTWDPVNDPEILPMTNGYELLN